MLATEHEQQQLYAPAYAPSWTTASVANRDARAAASCVAMAASSCSTPSRSSFLCALHVYSE